VPRNGQDNASIEATLDRMNLGNLIAALPFNEQTRQQLGDTQSEVSGTVHINGMPNAMSGVADIRSSQGRLAGEPLQSLDGPHDVHWLVSRRRQSRSDFNAGHIIASGKYDIKTKAFDLTASGDRVQFERLQASLITQPRLPERRLSRACMRRASPTT
jgi:hypothetical protein